MKYTWMILLIIIIASCSGSEGQSGGEWVYWTSPNPNTGLLDRVVILSSPERITEENVMAATIKVIVQDPAIPGQRDSAYLPYVSGSTEWVAAISYNTRFPEIRSRVSNALCFCGPDPIVLEWQ